MSELDEIRRRRMEQIQQQQMQQQQQPGMNYQQMQQEEQMRQQFEQQKKQALLRILTPEARQRLANLRLTKPDVVNAIEMQLIQLAESRQIQIPVSDATVKQILQSMTGKKREIHITRK